MKVHGNTKNLIDWFLGPTVVRSILGNSFILSSIHKNNIKEFFEYYGKDDRSSIWRKNIAIWIKYNVDNWIQRRKDLSMTSSNSKEWYQLMYGDDWELLYNKNCANLKKRLPSSIEFYQNNGHDKNEAMMLRNDRQRRVALKSAAKLKGTSEFTVRSPKYWVRQGFSIDEAKEKVKLIQIRDLDYFINKYGYKNGIERFEQSKTKRKNTWQTKDKIEHGKLTTPNWYNPNGQEMRAIYGFLESNNISESQCRFGSPREQFYQYIPDVGYRRYDLAVYETCEKKIDELKYIVEYHGPGHINFSDYNESLENELITIGGKNLAHLGTYGASYKNDQAKRKHILDNYPNVQYIIIWSNDLYEKRFRIDELLHRIKK